MAAALVVALTIVSPIARPHVALAAECTPTVGPGIPPPANVPSGIPGFHAHWYGQSGYPTLCPGQTSRATVAFYNSGSFGWQLGPLTTAYLGTWNPIPGQDEPSLLGGDSTNGSPSTRWASYNRPAIIPALYVGPNQIAWFQFTVKAPSVPGTYRLFIRPLIEGETWMEDFGVFWQVTVVAASTAPQRVTVSGVERDADVFTAGTTRFLYDRNDSFEYGDGTITYDEFEQILKSGDVVDVRYEPSGAATSTFNIVDDPPYGAPTVSTQIGSFDRGPTNNDIRVDLVPPASAGGQIVSYVLQRAAVPSGTSTCVATTGRYSFPGVGASGSQIDANVPAGTYCYRAGALQPTARQTAYGYSAPVTMPASPTPAPPVPPPTSLDALTIPSQEGAAGTFDFLDKLKVAFETRMQICGDDTVVRLRDSDGTVAELSLAARNIGCSVNRDAPETIGGTTYPASTVVTLTIAADPIFVSAGSTAGLQVPATVIAATGIRDEGGLSWDLGRSADLVFGNPD